VSCQETVKATDLEIDEGYGSGDKEMEIDLEVALAALAAAEAACVELEDTPERERERAAEAHGHAEAGGKDPSTERQIKYVAGKFSTWLSLHVRTIQNTAGSSPY
jgi:hypothetical protein